VELTQLHRRDVCSTLTKNQTLDWHSQLPTFVSGATRTLLAYGHTMQQSQLPNRHATTKQCHSMRYIHKTFTVCTITFREPKTEQPRALTATQHTKLCHFPCTPSGDISVQRSFKQAVTAFPACWLADWLFLFCTLPPELGTVMSARPETLMGDTISFFWGGGATQTT
jgi:hypothetical protein